MAGRHRSPYDPSAKRLQREAMKLQRKTMRRERAAREPEPANWWLIKFSITALLLSAACGVLVWFENRGASWVVGLQALIHLVNLIREVRAHLRYRAVFSPENAQR